MPTTDELLAQMEAEVLSTSANDTFVVDNDLRTITVPGSITVLGVEHDDDVHRLQFQLPKLYGEFDLSEFDIRINYVNAADKPDTYSVDDKEASGDNITFSWLVGRTAFEKMGDVKFNICLRKTDSDGVVIKEFNTTIATLPPVLEGLETTELIVQQNPDAIESILKRLKVLEQNGVGGGTSGGITEETDPTVPSWAKNPTKPTYTASEVGADSSGTAESKVSEHNAADDAHSDIRLLVQGLTTGKVNVTDIIDNLTTNVSNKPLSAAQGVALKALIDGITIPEKLPNPQKIIFTGAVTAEYDGSTEQTVNIPESTGGDSYTLPIMSDTQLGGGKAVAKTDEDVPVAVDPVTGQLFVPTYPENTGSSATPRQEMQNTDTTVTLEPNKLYVFPEMSSLTVTLAEPDNSNVANEYHFFFTSGATATTLTLNNVLSDAYSIEANMKYEVSILENVAYIKGVSTSA